MLKECSGWGTLRTFFPSGINGSVRCTAAAAISTLPSVSELSRNRFRAVVSKSCDTTRSTYWPCAAFSHVATNFPASRRNATPRRILSVSYTHLRAHETRHDLVCRLLLE